MPNPIQIEKYLRGIDYPATKPEIINKATENGADRRVLNILNRVAGQVFDSPAELNKAISKVKIK